MRISWVTDPHFDFIDEQGRAAFIASIAAEESDALFLTGDIARAANLLDCLAMFDELLSVPTYFVLGNHDYYGSSIATVRRQVAAFCLSRERLHWLSVAPCPISLGSSRSLIGHGGWGDGKIGDAWNSPINLSDWYYIEELLAADKGERLDRLARLGEEAARHIAQQLALAEAAGHRQIYVLTHVPPFREACWHNGEISDDDWAPHFTCAAVGEVLLHFARSNPDVALTVFCGHTHGAGVARLAPNLLVNTGKAVYRLPEIQETFTLPEEPVLARL